MQIDNVRKWHKAKQLEIAGCCSKDIYFWELKYFDKWQLGVGEMAHLLRAVTAFPEDSSWISSTHMAV